MTKPTTKRREVELEIKTIEALETFRKQNARHDFDDTIMYLISLADSYEESLEEA